MSSFGVVYDPERKAFDWSQFRALARLERKSDESLERYFNSFVNMCRTACKLPPRKEEGTEQAFTDISQSLNLLAGEILLFDLSLRLCVVVVFSFFVPDRSTLM